MGALVGVVRLTAVELCTDEEHARDRWAFGPFLWRMDSPRLLRRPIEYRGRLGLFEVPAIDPKDLEDPA